MSKLAVPLFLFALAADVGPLGAQTPSLTGTWAGAVVVRNDSLVTTITLREQDGAATGTISIADQYALGYPLRSVTRGGAGVRMELGENLFPGSLDGELDKGRIHGTFAGIVRGDSVAGTFEVWRRPPVDPPYGIEEIRFANGDLELAGTVYAPPGPGPHPGLVFLHGSGPQTRDSYIRWFADRFARAGFVTLIYDKRGTGESSGARWPETPGGFHELARDGAAAVRAVAARPDVDAGRIGVWGLSQGAWLGPLAAQGGGIAFVLMFSGGGVSPAEQELYDDEVKLRARGFPEEDISQAIAYLRLADDYVRSGSDADWERFATAREAARAESWYPHLDRFPQILPREAPVWAGLRTDLDYDPVPVLETIRVPVLVMLGERDELTPTQETARRIEAALSRAGNSEFTVRIVPGADHGLWLLPGAGRTWERPAPGWVEETLRWPRARAGLEE